MLSTAAICMAFKSTMNVINSKEQCVRFIMLLDGYLIRRDEDMDK